MCDSVADSTQESFDEGTDDSGAMFDMSGDKPGFVTEYQQENMARFSSKTPGWLVYWGTVGDARAGSNGTVSG